MSTSFVDQMSMAQQEQLCYIPCNFCNIVLAVSVPWNSLFEMVTVRCGYFTNVWSVNISAATAPFHHSLPMSSLQQVADSSPYPFHHQAQSSQDYKIDLGWRYSSNMMTPTPSNNQRVGNRPPEKKQRVPSAYNQFIKEEIQRIKANNPDITHREAFSTAAKNWAHFPHMHFGLMLETNNQPN